MVFSSLVFLTVFLPVFLAIYFLTPSRLKNWTALLASYFFYAWGAPVVVFFLFAFTVMDFCLGLFMATSAPSKKKWILAFSVLVNVSALAYFKYANFFLEQTNNVLSVMSFHTFTWTHILLPAGISFFTFHKISYMVDVHRGTVPASKSFINFALYVALFPQLIAGPIIRYHEIAGMIEKRSHSAEELLSGLFRFAVGLAKKVLIANTLASTADQAFAMRSSRAVYAWTGILAYTMQIYFDFSGYSDMAIGIAKMMGFKFPENFNRPYVAQNFTDFWRRWHISLSSWMRDYLYIPFGGNRAGSVRMYFNLCLVFFLSGLWHGAGWTFIIWGIYHGVFLVLDRVFWREYSARLPKFLNQVLTFILVLSGWVFFRADSLRGAFQYFKSMAGFGEFSNDRVLRPDFISNQGIATLILALAISLAPEGIFKSKILSEWEDRHFIKFGVTALLFFASYATLVNSSFNPFIYFRF